MEKPLYKLARTALSTWKMRQAKDQGGLCPLCKKPLDLRNPKDIVVDHDHTSGEIRGVLHRSCNAAEGKVANAAGRWGAGSMQYSAIVPWLENLLEYLKKPGTGFMYPMHKTADDKRDERNRKAREARAAAKAKLLMRSRKAQNG